jgi:uncharacterized membrane protein
VSAHDAPFDLYIAAYSDSTAADADWDQIKQLARDKVLTIEGLVLVSRDADGKIHVKDDDHDAGKGAAIGAVTGAIVGLIFPPALLASAAVGAGIGAGTGVLADLITKHGIRSDVENTLPPGSSGIVALVEERWVSDVEKALAQADKTEHHHIH